MALPYLFPQDASLFEGRGEVMALVAAALLVMAVAMRSEEGNLPVLVGLVSEVFMHGGRQGLRRCGVLSIYSPTLKVLR